MDPWSQYRCQNGTFIYTPYGSRFWEIKTQAVLERDFLRPILTLVEANIYVKMEPVLAFLDLSQAVYQNLLREHQWVIVTSLRLDKYLILPCTEWYSLSPPAEIKCFIKQAAYQSLGDASNTLV